MRKKKTAPRTQKHRKASSPQQSGLIATGKNAQQSATTKSALDNRSHKNTLLMVFLTGLALFAGDLIRFMPDPAFHPAAALVPIILIAYLFQSWSIFHGFGILITERTELYTVATWIAAGVALVGFLAVVPHLMAMGAALTAVASFGTRFALLYYFSRRLFPIAYNWTPVLRQCAMAALVCGVAYTVPAVGLGWSVFLRVALFGMYMAGVWWFGGLPGADRAAVAAAVASPRAAFQALPRS